jgi:hypothetical protein
MTRAIWPRPGIPLGASGRRRYAESGAPVPMRGTPLSGANSYDIVFPQGQLPPVSAFWSVILYDSDGSLVPNPINRYEVASHTPDLVIRSDGSLSITVTNTQPADPTTNWLPAPTSGFSLTLRTYLPQQPILSQTW